ncbi:hypothetical protein GMST_00870 [Geomonas silvestris]|uniref:Bacterial Ig-like domain-containing protein n=1 Tax=Geomonas silvestris TaxID=2740184 RepID=A0A6V8MCS2_9BACT|nr:Ig-like domain-containing protein [Geomonas silvestris]GFO57762.1 hypothetical protein GMST_00870 [Geomonas silvestris]
MRVNSFGQIVALLVPLCLAGCGGGGGGANPTVPPDTASPSVTLTSPAANARLTGVATLEATASDNVAVSRVEFYLGGTLKGTATSAPYAVGLDTSTLNRGSYTVTAKAFDAAGNLGVSQGVVVTVPISIFMTTQVSGSTAVGTVYLAGVGPQEVHGLSLTITGAHIVSVTPSGVAASAESLLVSGGDIILGSSTLFGPGEVMRINLDQVTQPTAIQATLTQVIDATFTQLPLQ